MKKLAIRILYCLTLGFITSTSFAGHPQLRDRDPVLQAAIQFEHAAARMQVIMYRVAGRSRATKDARRLARLASDFRYAVQYRHPDVLREQLTHLAGGFRELRVSMRHVAYGRETRRIRIHFRDLRDAFRVLKQETHYALHRRQWLGGVFRRPGWAAW